MTQAETNRGRGKPRAFDEDELLARVSSLDDLVRVRDALEANGEGLMARNAFAWLIAKWNGDPTGFTRRSESVYRAALARLPEIPLPPAPKRARAGRGQRGSAELVLVSAGAVAGAVALSALAGPQAANFVVALACRFAADNAPYVKLILSDPCDCAIYPLLRPSSDPSDCAIRGAHTLRAWRRR